MNTREIINRGRGTLCALLTTQNRGGGQERGEAKSGAEGEVVCCGSVHFE